MLCGVQNSRIASGTGQMANINHESKFAYNNDNKHWLYRNWSFIVMAAKYVRLTFSWNIYGTAYKCHYRTSFARQQNIPSINCNTNALARVKRHTEGHSADGGNPLHRYWQQTCSSQQKVYNNTKTASLCSGFKAFWQAESTWIFLRIKQRTLCHSKCCRLIRHNWHG